MPPRKPERREDEASRILMERAAELGAAKALRQFARDISPHDPTTHEGIMALRSDMYHAHKVRTICEGAKDKAFKTAIGAVVLAGLAALWQGLQFFNPGGPKP